MNLYRVIGDDLNSRGGHLQCETCGHKKKLGDTAVLLKHGWPKCHGKTMEWILPEAPVPTE